MNEVEELALDSVATGGPEEVLTEQANNNPDVPKVDPVETTALPEETPQNPVINEFTDEDVESSLINKNEPIPFVPFEDSPFAYDFYNNEELQFAGLGKSAQEVVKLLKDNGENLPLVGGWFKERKLYEQKKKEFEENTNRVLDDKTLTNQEQADLIKKELKEKGITYGEDANNLLLVTGQGSDLVNDITKQVYEDPRLTNGILGGNRVYGAKGDRKYPDEEFIDKTISYVANQYRAGIKAQSGGVDTLTTETMRQISDLTLLTDSSIEKNLLNLKSGQLPDLPTIFAMRDVFNIETMKLDKMINDLDTNAGPEDYLNVREQLELVANLQMKISGIKTDIGRALRSFQEPSRLGPDGQLIQVQSRPDTFTTKKSDQTDMVPDPIELSEGLESTLNRLGGLEGMKKFFVAYKSMPHKHGKMKLLKDFNSFNTNATGDLNKVGLFFDNISEYWMNALLSSPLTHARNMVGNFLMLSKEILEDYAIGTVNTVTGRGGRQFQDVHASAGAVVMAFMEAVNSSVLSFKTGIKPGQIADTSKIDVGQRRNSISSENWQANMDTPMIGVAIDNIGKTINIPTDMLDAEDTFFKVLAQRYYISLEARKSARSRGLIGDDALDYVTEFIVDPPQNALIDSQKKSNYLVFQEEIDGIAKGLAKARDIPGIRYLIPFFKTPYNITRVTFRDGTPLGVMFSKEQRALFMRSPEDREKMLTRMATGMTAIAIGSYLASEEVIIEEDVTVPKGTSALREEQFRDKNLQSYNTMLDQRGIPSYAVYTGEDKNGNPTYRSIRSLEPFSSFVGIGVDFYKIFNDPDLYGTEQEADAYKVFVGVATALGNSIQNKSFTQTVDRTFDLLQGDVNMENFAKGFATSFIPAIVRQIGDLEDPVSRQALTLWDTFARTVPGVRKLSPPKLDLNGDPRVRTTTVINPFKKTTVKRDEFTNLEKNEWMVLGRAPKLPSNKISTNFGVGQIEIKDKYLLHEIHQEFAKSYKKNMELFTKIDYLYKLHKKRWIESNYTDIESRDIAMARVNVKVDELRKAVIQNMFYQPNKYKYGIKLKKLINEKREKKANKQKRKVGLK